jgi:pyruvate kinase
MNLTGRRAKIVATVGPASSELAVLESLIRAGVDVFRFNFSHGSHDDHHARFKLVHEAARNVGKTVAVLQDLQGPKLRVGKFPGGSIVIEKSAEVHFVLEDRATIAVQPKSGPKLIPYNYERLLKEIRVGHRILMDDGNLEVVVTAIEGTVIKAQVVFGGTLKDHKGMNFPDSKLSVSSFTDKDREDLLFGMKMGVDYIALSFVRTADDIKNVKKFMHTHKKNLPVVSKIEMAEAIDHFKDILQVTDAIMVARGDLAVEVGTAKVPSLQKDIIRQANQAGIPVITATQMLESMIAAPRPTRAEASDVANAVLDGSDALMLSAESASGKFPVLAVSVMHNIILETELRNKPSLNAPFRFIPGADSTLAEAVEFAAASLIRAVGAKAAVCVTHTGESALALSQHRPACPIVALTDSEEVSRRLALVWGIHAQVLKNDEIPEDDTRLESYFDVAERNLVNMGVLDKGDLFVCSAGAPPLKHGATNTLKVVKVRYSRDPAKTKPGDNITGYRTRKAQFVIDQNLCTQCGGCVEVCPNDIFGVQNRKVYLKESNCRNCTFDNACMEICPTNAIEVIKFAD